MLKVGLTGGIGSGKSTITKVFQVLGVPVFISDEEGKRLLRENKRVREHIIELFGSEAYKGADPDRKYLASRVFSNKEELKKLNAIIHPAVRKRFLQWAEEQKPAKYVLEESALLFESGHFVDFDYTIFVAADKETRLRRVMARDGVSRGQVLHRMRNQMSDEEKSALADFIITNGGDNLIIPSIVELHNKFLSL